MSDKTGRRGGRADELRRRHQVLGLEVAAEVRGLFEAEFGGDLFDELAGEEELFGGADALFVEPALGRAAELAMEFALELAAGEAAQPREISGVIPRFLRQRLPFIFV